jgi:hypothetical protein
VSAAKDDEQRRSVYAQWVNNPPAPLDDIRPDERVTHCPWSLLHDHVAWAGSSPMRLRPASPHQVPIVMKKVMKRITQKEEEVQKEFHERMASSTSTSTSASTSTLTSTSTEQQ